MGWCALGNRGVRRQQKARAKRKARKIVKRIMGSTFPVTDRAVGIRARTMQLCSCIGCGNERVHDGPTRQELRAALDDGADA